MADRKFAGSSEGFRRFRRAKTARGDERVAVGHVQLRQSLPLRHIGLDLIRLIKRRQQRLRLCDFRHFWRRRKAFERGRENGVGVDGARSRLVELGERQRGAQFKTARGLLLCDGDRGQEGVFSGRGIG